MRDHEVIRAAASRIGEERKWTQHAAARDKNGISRDGEDPDAVCWCVLAAIKLELDKCGRSHDDVDFFVRHFGGVTAMIDLNDDPSTKHEELLTFLERVAVEAERIDHGV